MCGGPLARATVYTPDLIGGQGIAGRVTCPQRCSAPSGSSAWDTAEGAHVVRWPVDAERGLLQSMLLGQLSAGWSPGDGQPSQSLDGRHLVYDMVRVGFQGPRG